MRTITASHIARMLLGYAAATLAITMSVYLPFSLLLLADDIRNGGDVDLSLFQPQALPIIGSAAAGICVIAFPAWILLAIFAEQNRKQDINWFVRAGMITASLLYLAASIFVFRRTFSAIRGMGDFIFTFSLLWIFALVAGAVGGLTYWAIAGRLSGTWIHPQTPEPSASAKADT